MAHIADLYGPYNFPEVCFLQSALIKNRLYPQIKQQAMPLF